VSAPLAMVLLCGSERVRQKRVTMADTFVILDAVYEALLAEEKKRIGMIATFGGHGFESMGVKWAHSLGIMTVRGCLNPVGPGYDRRESNRQRVIEMLAPDLVVLFGTRHACANTLRICKRLGVPVLNVNRFPPTEAVEARAKSIQDDAGAGRRADKGDSRVHGESPEPRRHAVRSGNGRFVAKDSTP
jgi:hypothetical protein